MEESKLKEWGQSLWKIIKNNSQPLMVCITLFSLIVMIAMYFGSRSDSKDALDKAEKALKQTKDKFIVENRPYLNIRAIKHKDTESYVKATIKNKSEVWVEINFEIENAGDTPAKNVHDSKMLTVLFKDKENLSQPREDQHFYEPTKLMIGPGEKKNFLRGIGFGTDSNFEERAEQLINDIKSYFSARLSISYSSDLGEGELVCNKIVAYEYRDNNKPILVKSDEICSHKDVP